MKFALKQSGTEYVDEINGDVPYYKPSAGQSANDVAKQLGCRTLDFSEWRSSEKFKVIAAVDCGTGTSAFCVRIGDERR